MPTYAQSPGDIKWAVQLQSGTAYSTYNSALAAAVTLSAGNSNAPVSIFSVEELLNGPATGVGNITQPSAYMGPSLWFVQLASGTTYVGEENARVAGRVLSGSNGNAPVQLGRLFINVTAP